MVARLVSFSMLVPAMIPLGAGLFVSPSASAQTASEESYRVYTDSPRLLLTHQRLRLLQRERQRVSMRWQQLDSLLSSGAPMPEPGFAWALDYQVARDDAAGKKAVEWALGNATDLRQLALVFDWCGAAMTDAQADQLSSRIVKALAAPVPADVDVRTQSARALAAIAVADRLPDRGEAVLRGIVQDWWRGNVVKQIGQGKPAIPREQVYALYEMLHAIRDNLKIDLRESAASYFKELPLDHLAGHYPAPYPAPENEFRIPVYVREGEPDLKAAARSRAAELAMVAYDNNALDSQFLQGWLMQDSYEMRGAFGAAYEFLWANPYQPGLSYYHIPLVFHNPETGHVFARTSWDDDATWIGYFDGSLQLFSKGQVQTLRAGVAAKPVQIGDALLLGAESKDAARFHADASTVFVLNLAPHADYDVEVDNEELQDAETDAGGTLVLSFPAAVHAGIRIRKR